MARRLAWLMGVVWLYVALRVVAGLPVGLGPRIGVALVLLVIAEQHWWSSRWFGSLAVAELPRGVLVVLAWGFTGLMLFALLSVARDIAGGIVFAFVRVDGRRVLAGEVTAALAVVSAAATAFGVWQAVRVPRIRTVHLDLAGLAPAFDGYCIVQLSDLHASRLLTPRWMTAVVARANAQQPDLVVITGDVADGIPPVRAAGVRPLGALRAPDGVLAITGNHEYYSDYAGWMQAYRDMGVRVLDNAHVVVRRGDATLVIAGVTDVQAREYGDPVPDLAAALRAAPPGASVILLQHRPGDPQANARAGIALQLSGHTHGGQVRGFDLLVARANRGFVSGLYQVGRMQLYVSNGTGLWAGFAIRLGRPSEITRLVLHPKADHPLRDEGRSEANAQRRGDDTRTPGNATETCMPGIGATAIQRPSCELPHIPLGLPSCGREKKCSAALRAREGGKIASPQRCAIVGNGSTEAAGDVWLRCGRSRGSVIGANLLKSVLPLARGLLFQPPGEVAFRPSGCSPIATATRSNDSTRRAGSYRLAVRISSSG